MQPCIFRRPLVGSGPGFSVPRQYECELPGSTASIGRSFRSKGLMDYPSTISHDGQGHTWTIPLKDTLQLNVQSLKTRHIPWPGEAQPDAPKARDRVAGGLWDGARKKSNIVVCSFVLFACLCVLWRVCKCLWKKHRVQAVNVAFTQWYFLGVVEVVLVARSVLGSAAWKTYPVLSIQEISAKTKTGLTSEALCPNASVPIFQASFFLDGGTCEVRSSPPGPAKG